MYCRSCGANIPDNSFVCPVCNAQLSSSMGQGQPVYNQPGYQQSGVNSKQKPKPPKSRGIAMVITALLAFPGLIFLVIDYIGAPKFLLEFAFFQKPFFAAGEISVVSAYFIGILMCLWMAIALPLLKPKRPAIAICSCLAVVSIYLLFLSAVNNNAGFYTEYILPISLMLTISSAIMSILISYKIIKKEHIASAIMAQLALLGIGAESVLQNNLLGKIELRYSLVSAVVLVGFVLIYEAIRYAVNMHKK